MCCLSPKALRMLYKLFNLHNASVKEATVMPSLTMVKLRHRKCELFALLPILRCSAGIEHTSPRPKFCVTKVLVIVTLGKITFCPILTAK